MPVAEALVNVGLGERPAAQVKLGYFGQVEAAKH